MKRARQASLSAPPTAKLRATLLALTLLASVAAIGLGTQKASACGGPPVEYYRAANASDVIVGRVVGVEELESAPDQAGTLISLWEVKMVVKSKIKGAETAEGELVSLYMVSQASTGRMAEMAATPTKAWNDYPSVPSRLDNVIVFGVSRGEGSFVLPEQTSFYLVPASEQSVQQVTRDVLASNNDYVTIY